MKMLGPVTAEDRALADLLAEALRDPQRPKMDVNDDPESIHPDDAYAVGMHLARLVAAGKPLTG